MDDSKKITLHPNAKNFLFENFIILRRIFSDVLGQLDVDYISIALINQAGELFFLSSNPSIEQNLIEKKLWTHDPVNQNEFIYQNALKQWSELYSFSHSVLLKQYKLHNQQLIEGISMPIDYGHYRAVFSFGFKKASSLVKINTDNYEKLVVLGRYCLNKINNAILFPDKRGGTVKPALTLIINRLSES
jgi:hypothetical protein